MYFILLKSPTDIISKICLLISIFLFIIFGISNAFVYRDSLGMSGIQYLIIAIMAGICSIVFFVYVRIITARLRYLRKYGIRFPAKIIKLVKSEKPKMSIVRIGSIADTYILCLYTNKLGMDCVVKSRLFLWNSHDFSRLRAIVYVDKHNPHRYEIEVMKNE